jgi:hypothetical protein
VGEIVELGKRGPHLEGPARCVRCKHEWRAVSPEGVLDGLQCPECKLFTGVRLGLIGPDAQRWACNCGNELFYLTPTGAPLCCNCGLRATSWVDG